jgi:hypothetical protein
MASSSSFVGYHFDMPKKDLVDFDKKVYHPDLKIRVNEYIAQAKEGPVHPIVNVFTKDELLPIEKIQANLPRNIYGHDLAYNLVLKMFFGDLVNHMTRHQSQTSCAVGMDPHTDAWRAFYQKTHVHPNIVATDLSKQEASTSPVFVERFHEWVCFNTLIEDDVHATILYNLTCGLDSYYLIVDDVIYVTLRGHSSGHFLTTLFNSFQVWAGYKLVFMDLAPDLTFEKEVSLGTGGDDSIGTVSNAAADRFNMITISKGFMDKFGMKCTGSNKAGELVPFYQTSDPEHIFLSRRFLGHGDRIAAPLKKEAIKNLVMWTAKVPGMNQEQVDKLRFDIALKEASVHGRPYYKEVRDFIFACCKNHGVTPPRLPTWAQAQQAINANYYGSYIGVSSGVVAPALKA